MANDEKWQRARLFPVTGLATQTSRSGEDLRCCLAVLSSVKEFGRALTMRCGAPAGRSRPSSRCLSTLDGKHCRPDGLIRVTRGQKDLDRTRRGQDRPQRSQGRPGHHLPRRRPGPRLRRRHHHQPPGGDDPGRPPGQRRQAQDPQGGSLITSHGAASTPRRSSSTPTTRSPTPTRPGCSPSSSATSRTAKSGALDFEDMGPSWVTVRNGAANQTLRANDAETLGGRRPLRPARCVLRHGALPTARRPRVTNGSPRPSSTTRPPGCRTRLPSLAKNGQLSGALLVPNAAVPVEITVDLRANRIDAKATIAAPTDRRASARVTWLLNQLKAAPPTLQVVANVARAKSSGRSYALAALLEDPKAIVEAPQRRHPLVHPHPQPDGGHQARPGQGLLRQLGHLARRRASTTTSSSRSRRGPRRRPSPKRRRPMALRPRCSLRRPTPRRLSRARRLPRWAPRPELAPPPAWPAASAAD